MKPKFDVNSDGWIEEVFTYHAPNDKQKVSYEELRTAARQFAEVLVRTTPKCADQSAALRKLRECVMTANASIALQGLI